MLYIIKESQIAIEKYKLVNTHTNTAKQDMCVINDPLGQIYSPRQ